MTTHTTITPDDVGRASRNLARGFGLPEASAQKIGADALAILAAGAEPREAIACARNMAECEAMLTRAAA